jgi:hypothetical protein
MNDLFRDFLVWLMGFTGCSVLVFAAVCFAKKQFKCRQKQVTGKHPGVTDASNPAADSQFSPKSKWLVFALAPVLYLLLLGPALSELNTHFQKIQSERAMFTQTVDIPQTIEPIPDSIGTRGPSRIGYQNSNNQSYKTSPCSCRKENGQETPTQSANSDVPPDSDESEWELSPGCQLSLGDINDVAEGDVAEIEQNDQVD